MMAEISRREKQAGIVPESEIDTYMKVTYNLDVNIRLKVIFLFLDIWPRVGQAISVSGLERTLQTDYTLKVT